VFRDSPKGNYVVRAPSAPGYLVGGYGQNRPYGPVQPITLSADDSKIGDLTIRLWKTSAIGDTVVDETGEPLVGLSVTALRRTLANGMVRLASATTASTDDRGVYRMPTLGPGDYLVAVTASLTTIPTSTADAFAQAMNSGGSFVNSEIYRSMMSSGMPLPSSGGYRVGDLILTASGYGGMITPPTPDDDRQVMVPDDGLPGRAIRIAGHHRETRIRRRSLRHRSAAEACAGRSGVRHGRRTRRAHGEYRRQVVLGRQRRDHGLHAKPGICRDAD
jgi:hypothetical protein